MLILRKPSFNDSPVLSTHQVQAAVQHYAKTNPAAVVCFFDRQLLAKLLEHPGCVGIRVYFGLDEQNRAQLLAVGTDALLNDMLRGQVLASSQPSANFLGGRLINKRRAALWTASYRRSVAGQNAFHGFLLEAPTLAVLLNESSAGIAFYYALDEQQRLIIMPCGIESGNISRMDFQPNHQPCPPCCSLEDWWTLLGFSLNQDGPRSQQLRVSAAAAQLKQPV